MQANKLLVGILFHFPLLVFADETPNVNDLERIQSETIIIKAQAKREEAQAELASRRQGQGNVGVNVDSTLPVLKSIYGTEQRLTATFIYPGNIFVEANEGDPIPGGYRLNKIVANTSKVELTKGHEKYQIGFSTMAPTSPKLTSQTPQGQGSFVPGINR
jgi:hypothetical protein